RQVGAELEAILHGYENQWTRSTPPPHEMTVIATPSTPLPPRHNLPVQATAFVGRDEELAEIRRLLADPSCHLVTIVAQGGMGKTRLSIEAARAQLTNFENGVFFVPLAPLTSPEAIPAAIAEAVGFSFFGTDEPKVQLINFLREKHMLLVMDNFEHVIAGAPLISEILQAAPDVKVLVTSRERLRLQGEWTLQLEGLKFPDYLTPEELSQYSALQLFVQSARRVQPDFTVTNENKKCMAQITQMVEGMPLAIELAAAWLEALPLSELVQEIQKSIDFLETDIRDIPERHRSIRAVFDYSWQLLTEDEQEVFKRLSVFRGGFTREAAQEVAGASLRTLTTLVNKSLLRRHERYEIHELLRQYAAEKCLMSRTQVRDTHSRYYLNFLASIQSRVMSADFSSVMQQVDAEMDNIRIAWDWAVENQFEAEITSAMHSLYEIYETRSMYAEGGKRFEQAMEVFRETPTYYKLRLYKTWLEMRLSDYYTAAQIAEESVTYFQETQQPDMTAFAAGMACYALMNMGEYDKAKLYGKMSIELRKEPVPATAYANLGYVYYLTGEYQEARRWMEKSREVAEQSGTPFGLGFSYNNLGEILQAMGQFEEACGLYEKAYNAFKQIRNRRGMAFTQNNIGGVYYFLGDINRALENYQKAYELNKEIGDRTGIGHSLSALGNWHFQMRQYEKARAYYEESLAIRREICDQRAIADSLTDVAEALYADRQYDHALTYYQEGLTMRREIGDQHGLAFSLAYVGRNLLQLGQYVEAETHLLEAQAIARQINTPGAIVQSLSYLIVLKIIVEKFAEARHYYEEIAPFEEKAATIPWWSALNQSLLGLIEIGEGKTDNALRHLLEVLDTRKDRRRATALALWGLAQIQAQRHPQKAVMLLAYLLHSSEGETAAVFHPKMRTLLETFQIPDFQQAYDRGKSMTPEAILQETLNDLR
ncbi:MAG: tetratricopeptide repeat protein, partial [Anaerolineae bacterium]|nr:tetratricopeptide repeat protein [Anaerolineae bacterium]